MVIPEMHCRAGYPNLVARDIDSPQLRLFHGCSPNPNDARISWWQNLHLQIIAEQRILQC
jgi:hypothetical protein